MRQIRADLWETSSERSYPGITTHAYLWTGGDTGNVLFYSTETDDAFGEFDALGGVAHQYLSHLREAGPMLRSISERYDSQLHAPAAELLDIGMHAHVDVPVGSRHVDRNGIEVIPTPGHSPGSTCYLVPGAYGQSYLFTGDTIMQDPDGNWIPGYIPSLSEARALSRSLQVLAGLQPDLVITSAFPGESGVHVPGARRWAQCVEQARERLGLVA
jgi:hydroxyacylglutathione hydrolase